MKSADVRRSARRVQVARAVLLLAFVALALRAAHLAVFDQRGLERGDRQSLRTLTLAPERGQVLDRSGATLALSIDAPSVYAIPARLEDAGDAARRLARILGLDRRRLERTLRERTSFRFLARWVDAETAEQVEAIGLAGVGVVREPRRVYPHRALAARVVGFANIDGRGVRGIEQQEDDWLRGTTRRLPVERDGSGRLMLVEGGSTRGTSGGDVALTLDAAMQADAEHALAAAIERTGARGGIVISMDPHRGEIFSLAEAPSFDPNHFRTLDYDSTGSGAFLSAVEPGSAFKAFLIAAALESGALAAGELVDCGDGTLRVPGKTIRDASAHGPLDAGGILRVSSNVGAVKVAHALGRRAHFQMLELFGFGHATGSGFPDESAGVLRPWQRWQPVDHATIAFGQGVSVTPVQLAAATATLANGGAWVRPRLVRARRAAGGPWLPTAGEAVRQVLAPETAARVREMLEGVVGEDGTGRRAALGGVRIAGKTGTAQKWDAEAGRYSDDRFRAWFVGIAPADAPRLVIVAGLDEPKRPLHTGGAAAAPLFAEVAEAHLARFGIRTNGESPLPAPVRRAETHTVEADAPMPEEAVVAAAAEAPAPEQTPEDVATQAAPEQAPADVAQTPAVGAGLELAGAGATPDAAASVALAHFRDHVLLPDFSGLSVDEVTRITASQAVIVRVRGRGRALRQDPPPGTIVPAGGIVTIDFDARGAPASSGGGAAREGRAAAAPDATGGQS